MFRDEGRERYLDRKKMRHVGITHHIVSCDFEVMAACERANGRLLPFKEGAVASRRS